MTLAELQQLACEFGLKANGTRATQTELIRTIQVLRGGEPCFSTAKRHDCVDVCEWRRSCRKAGAVWLH